MQASKTPDQLEAVNSQGAQGSSLPTFKTENYEFRYKPKHRKNSPPEAEMRTSNRFRKAQKAELFRNPSDDYGKGPLAAG